MKVENPRYFEAGDVYCQDCPYADKNGYPVLGTCPGDAAIGPCPTAETYAEAVKLVEEGL